MITILDFEKGEVHAYHVSPKFDWGNVEDFLMDRGHNLNNCQYMSTDNVHQFITHAIFTP